MNERIKELVKTAEYWANTFEDKSRYQEYLMKTFAELIVRECAQVAEEVDGNSRARKCVLEHFGVEE